MTADRLRATVEDLSAELVAFRRRLHRHPEPSWEEHETTAALVERLRAAGLSPEPTRIGTGLVCDIGEGGGPLVALRADIDALRMVDTKSVPYRSEVPGVCHACGHDVHTTAVLGAGLALDRQLQATGIAGRVRLIFQPAEEVIPSGAVVMVDEGAMEGVAAIFALHCDPSVDVGAVGLSAGSITSASDMIEVRLKGPGGHTARPHRTADLVHVAARVVVDLPAALARLTDSRDGVNLTFGAIEAGDAANVIPTQAVVRGSFRAMGRGSWEAAPELFARLLPAIVEPLGATWELDHRVGVPPVENDPWAVGVVRRAIEPAIGAAAVRPTRQSAGGDDFSWFLDHAPGCYLRLGVHTPGTPLVDIHAGAFDVDERAIGLGAELLARTAVEALAELSG
jgi:amidohydrolase